MGLIFKTADGVLVPVGCTVYGLDGSPEVLTGDSHQKNVASFCFSTPLAAAKDRLAGFEEFQKSLMETDPESPQIKWLDRDIKDASDQVAKLSES